MGTTLSTPRPAWQFFFSLSGWAQAGPYSPMARALAWAPARGSLAWDNTERSAGAPRLKVRTSRGVNRPVQLQRLHPFLVPLFSVALRNPLPPAFLTLPPIFTQPARK